MVDANHNCRLHWMSAMTSVVPTFEKHFAQIILRAPLRYELKVTSDYALDLYSYPRSDDIVAVFQLVYDLSILIVAWIHNDGSKQSKSMYTNRISEDYQSKNKENLYESIEL